MIDTEHSTTSSSNEEEKGPGNGINVWRREVFLCHSVFHLWIRNGRKTNVPRNSEHWREKLSFLILVKEKKLFQRQRASHALKRKFLFQ